MPSTTLDIRSRYATAPTTLPTSWRNITVNHPGYAKPHWLLCWPAYDPAPSSENPHLWGCNHRVVLDACQIIANNCSGFFSTTPQRNDSDRVSESEYTLTADVYYYCLYDDSDPQYAIVAEFSAWSFPDVLPPHWKAARPDDPHRWMFHASESAMSTKVKALDSACVTSGVRRGDSCDNACLVPRDQEVWFVVNRMYFYNTNPRMRRPNDVANVVCLRADIHRCLDQHAFMFYPAGTEFVAYFIEADYDYPE
ncbi:hypothetical protein DAEQUDRAFT_769400 [Daedalea quercina L-15889]|uniref:HNH nuclease domain-containing protein n=1 Tax=Daedalea quercina L-15889 TaxID=1314783 RepID=A0A165LRC7_9APHY|nr:hypothetical protein DAEQUDRAFT_769400 [Daedalea quercina L-15889]